MGAGDARQGSMGRAAAPALTPFDGSSVLPAFLQRQTFHGPSKVQRNKRLKGVQEKGGICLTTYGMVVSNIDLLNDDDFEWDYVILDEGHRIKDPSRQTSKAMREVASKHRMILSGPWPPRLCWCQMGSGSWMPPILTCSPLARQARPSRTTSASCGPSLTLSALVRSSAASATLSCSLPTP